MRSAAAARWVLLAVATACSGRQPLAATDAGSCIPVGSTALYCAADADCCSGGFCDPVLERCRLSAQCGAPGDWCSAVHACCSNAVCEADDACHGPGIATATGTGAGSTSATGTSGSGGSCLAGGAACLVASDCCSGVCDPALGGGQACAARSSTATSTTGGSSGTTGGNCFTAGTGCQQLTDCCSGLICREGVCQ